MQYDNTIFANIIFFRPILDHLMWIRAGLPRLANHVLSQDFPRSCYFKQGVIKMELAKVLSDTGDYYTCKMIIASCQNNQRTNNKKITESVWLKQSVSFFSEDLKFLVSRTMFLLLDLSFFLTQKVLMKAYYWVVYSC